MDKQLKKEFEAMKAFDIHKMSVKDLAFASENNPLMQSSIWTKAYKMEAELTTANERIAKIQENWGIVRPSMVCDRFEFEAIKEIDELLKGE